MKIPYPANIYVVNALRMAIIELETTIKTCGELNYPETKLSLDAKNYFAKQSREAQEIIAELMTHIKDINTSENF